MKGENQDIRKHNLIHYLIIKGRGKEYYIQISL